MIGVVDYNAGNLKSVELALRFLGQEFFITGDPEKLRTADRMIFPGVGEASSSMNFMRDRGLDGAVKDFAATGKPLLGICLGCQILLDRSEEGGTDCLGLIPGTVRLFKPVKGLKIPHMGWNQVRHEDRHPLFTGIPENASFYFVHSFYTEPADSSSVIGSTEYGTDFASALAEGNVSAAQFHPEKSGKWGLKMLENFCSF